MSSLEEKVGEGSPLLIKFLGIVDMFERIVSSHEDDVQLTSSGKTLLTFGGIILILVLIFIIVQKVSRK